MGYIRVELQSGKRSSFSVVQFGDSKPVSMGRAYDLYSKSGFGLKVYKNGKHKKSYAGSRVNHFGPATLGDIEKLAVSDSYNHDFKKGEMKSISENAWKQSGFVPLVTVNGKLDVLDETTIHKKIWNNEIRQESIMYYDKQNPGNDRFWQQSRLTTLDASPIGQPFFKKYQKVRGSTKSESSWKPYNELLYTNGEPDINIFTLTDAQTTGSPLALNYIASRLKGKGTQGSFTATPGKGPARVEAPTDGTFSLTGKVVYQILPNSVNMSFTEFKAGPFNGRKFDDYFSSVIVYFGAPPVSYGRKLWFEFGNCQVYSEKGSPKHIFCRNRGPSVNELTMITKQLIKMEPQNDQDRGRRICRLMEIKRLGDWGQVYSTTLGTDTNLITKDQPAYYYAYLLKELGKRPRVAITSGRIHGSKGNVSKAVGIAQESGSAKPLLYPEYTPAPAPPKPAKLTYYYTKLDKVNNTGDKVGVYLNKWYKMSWEGDVYYVMIMIYETQFIIPQKKEPTKKDQRVRYTSADGIYDGVIREVRNKTFQIGWDNGRPTGIKSNEWIPQKKLKLLGISAVNLQIGRQRIAYQYVSLDGNTGKLYQADDGSSLSEEDNYIGGKKGFSLSAILSEITVKDVEKFDRWKTRKQRWSVENQAFFDSMVEQAKLTAAGAEPKIKELQQNAKKYITSWAKMLRNLSDATIEYSDEVDPVSDYDTFSMFGGKRKRQSTPGKRLRTPSRGPPLRMEGLVEMMVNALENDNGSGYDRSLLETVLGVYSNYVFNSSWISIRIYTKGNKWAVRYDNLRKSVLNSDPMIITPVSSGRRGTKRRTKKNKIKKNNILYSK